MISLNSHRMTLYPSSPSSEDCNGVTDKKGNDREHEQQADSASDNDKK